MSNDKSDASYAVRRIVLPLVVGVCIGFGLSSLPAPANWLSTLGLALAALIWSAWALIDLRKHKRRLEQLAAEAQAYIDSYNRHPRVP